MLISLDFKLLAVLDEQGGITTGQVSERASFSYGGTKRQRSGAVRFWLMRLKANGLVTLMDDQKPDCWIRTPAGTVAVGEKAD